MLIKSYNLNLKYFSEIDQIFVSTIDCPIAIYICSLLFRQKDSEMAFVTNFKFPTQYFYRAAMKIYRFCGGPSLLEDSLPDQSPVFTNTQILPPCFFS